MQKYIYTPSRFMLPDSYYDAKRADHAVAFIEQLKHVKTNEWAGKFFKLLPWQETVIRDLFGIINKNGYRQFRHAFVEVPKKSGKMLDEIKEGIINAYEQKTRQPRQKISQWMDMETCFNAKKAVELGFADGVLYSDNISGTDDLFESVLFSRANVTNSLSKKLQKLHKQNSINEYYNRLNRIRF